MTRPAGSGAGFARAVGDGGPAITLAQGRLDDTFVYTRGVSIRPHVFRSSLGQYRPIVECQVRQTERGADMRVVAIGQALAALGLDRPR